MKSFIEFINEGYKTAANTHMRHIDDLILYGGVEGARDAINALRNMRDILGGSAAKSVDVSLKADGCVSPDTILVTENGEMTILEYIEKYTDNIGVATGPKILARNIDQNRDEYTSVEFGVAKVGSKLWIRLDLENGTSLKLTEDHEVYLNNKTWKPAKDLINGDDIYQIY
jgi:hypothetical protein